MICNSSTMNRVVDIHYKSDEYLSKDFYRHSTFIDYLVDHNIDIRIFNYNYGKKWIIKRSD